MDAFKLLETLLDDHKFSAIYWNATEGEQWHIVIGICLGKGMSLDEAIDFAYKFVVE